MEKWENANRVQGRGLGRAEKIGEKGDWRQEQSGQALSPYLEEGDPTEIQIHFPESILLLEWTFPPIPATLSAPRPKLHPRNSRN